MCGTVKGAPDVMSAKTVFAHAPLTRFPFPSQHLTEGHSVLRGRCHEVTDEVRPRSGRAVIASFGEVKFVRRDESAFGVMLSKMSAFADISPIGDKKSSRTFQRNFSEEKFLSEGPQSDCNRHEGPSLFMPLCGMKIHSSCALRMQRKFRALRSATKGSAFGIRELFNHFRFAEVQARPKLCSSVRI